MFVFILVTLLLVNASYQCSFSSDDIYHDIKCLQINCMRKPWEKIKVNTNETKKFHYVIINNCEVPSKTYVDVFKTLQIDLKATKTLTIVNLVGRAKLDANSFMNLTNLEELVISSGREDMKAMTFSFTLQRGFLTPLKSLKAIKLVGFFLPEMTELSKIQTIVIKYSTLYTLKECEHLEKLVIEKCYFLDLLMNKYESWLKNCRNLKELEISNMNSSFVQTSLIELNSLERLTISMCDMSLLKNSFLQDAVNLRSLKLFRNSLWNIERDAFKNLIYLEELDLSSNNCNNDIKYALSPLKSLRSLTLDKNVHLNVCDLLNVIQPLSLQILSVKYTSFNTLSFNSWQNLTTLDLEGATIDVMKFSDLPRPKSEDLLVNLRYVRVKEIESTQEEYNIAVKTFSQVKNITILLGNITLDCDCQHGWFARILRSLPNLSIKGHIHCFNGTLLSETPFDLLECNKIACDKCTCRQLWTNVTIADCNKRNILELPRIDRPKKIYAKGNLIERVYEENFPDTLEFADLSDNRISVISAEVVKRMFKDHRQWKLTQNPWACLCNTKPLISALHRYRTKILDFDNLICANDGKLLKDVTPSELCEETTSSIIFIPLVLASVTLLLVIMFAALYGRYKQSLLLYLFRKGFCIPCLNEKDLDDDRIYDAFISFCHSDEEFISQNIFPHLADYKLCLHYRDWVAGEWIPRQIATSIEVSKRTILILSRDFVHSLWGMLEFRMAHSSALKENRNKLIAIIIDDLLEVEESLDAELRNYLSNNTYIKWGDPWFFEKLKYSLPHSKIRDDRGGMDLNDFAVAVERYGTKL